MIDWYRRLPSALRVPLGFGLVTLAICGLPTALVMIFMGAGEWFGDLDGPLAIVVGLVLLLGLNHYLPRLVTRHGLSLSRLLHSLDGREPPGEQ